MYGLPGQLAARREIELAVATVYQCNELKIFDLDGARYYDAGLSQIDILLNMSLDIYKKNMQKIF